MSNTTLFLLSWDQLGLESIVNITDLEKELTWHMLQDKASPKKLGSIVNSMMLRARYNPQRHYEIYTVTVAEGITEEDIRDMFEETPQEAANMIRERGCKIFSDRVKSDSIKIT